MGFGISFFDFLEYLKIISKTHPPQLHSREPEEKNRREQDYCSRWHYIITVYDESTHTLTHTKRYEILISTWKDKYGESVCVVWGGGGLKTHLLSLLGGGWACQIGAQEASCNIHTSPTASMQPHGDLEHLYSCIQRCTMSYRSS